MNERFTDAAAALDAVPSAPEGEGEIDEVAVWRALATVIDPEIGLDVVTLGLVYEVECIESVVRVTFSLTTPGCPMVGVITGGIEQAVAGVPRVEQVLAERVWEPAWNPGMIREDAW